MTRRSYSALSPLVGATMGLLAVACAPLSFGARAPEPEPERVVVPAPPAWEAPVAAAANASDAEGITRLVQFGDVWQTVRWFHPDVVGRASAWDTAYLRHVDDARDAANNEQFVAAVHALLGELHDPDTRVVPAQALSTRDARRDGVRASVVWHTADSVLLARPVAFATAREFALQQRRLPATLLDRAPATVGVLDLRADSGGSGNDAWWTRPPAAAELAVRGTLEAPARRRVRRSGPPVIEDAQSACCTQWTLGTGPRIDAASPSAAEPEDLPATLVVIVNDATVVPPELFTVHASGRVLFVSSGTGVLQSDAAAVRVPLIGGVEARVRTAELLLANGHPVPTRADTTVAATRLADALVPDTVDVAIQAALSIAREYRRNAPPPPAGESTASRLTVADAPVSIPDSASIALFPSLPERLHAVTALWAVIRTFDPYVPVADESWDEKFGRALQEAETATSSRTHAAALTRFAAALDASQVDVMAPDHPEFGRRRGAVPFHITLVERRAIVTSIQDSATERSGVHVGDEMLAIGGEPIENRLGRLRDLIAASNNWSREQRLERWLESGPALVKATYRVRSSTTDSRDVEFSYSEALAATRAPVLARQVDSLSGGSVRVRVDDAIGAQRDSADRAPRVPLPDFVAQSQAVIVDLRGVRSDLALRWLAGTALDAGGRPYVRDARIEVTAPPRGGLRTPELDPARQVTWTERSAPPATGDVFAGPMAILIDATTIGEGEVLALRLAGGDGNRMLIGSTTAGAVGRVASVPLAGGVLVQFPVSDTRRPDGRLIQRLGVPPDIMATPTVAGIRAGRDEVLEAAQRWIARQLAPPPPARRR